MIYLQNSLIPIVCCQYVKQTWLSTWCPQSSWCLNHKKSYTGNPKDNNEKKKKGMTLDTIIKYGHLPLCKPLVSERSKALKCTVLKGHRSITLAINGLFTDKISEFLLWNIYTYKNCCYMNHVKSYIVTLGLGFDLAL